MKIRATVICEQDRHILLVRKLKCRWTLPGGKVERGESHAAAAERELWEETGLVVDQVLYLMALTAGDTEHHVFEASVIDVDRVHPHNEIIDCIWHPLESVANLNVSEATVRIVKAFQRRL